ncbi:MAG: YmdB family metallophosphoesterase [Merdibacter sp.]
MSGGKWSEAISLLTSRYQIDLVVANGENAAHGKGITRRIYHQLIGYGIDVMTMGNHTFAKSDLYNFIDEADRMVRPMNMAPTEYGRSVLVRK